MDNKIRLIQKHIRYLSSLPEQGMGYQVVDIKLRNGTILKNRIVLNSSLLQLENSENIDPNEIDSVELQK